jgi:hypothetical protein
MIIIIDNALLPTLAILDIRIVRYCHSIVNGLRVSVAIVCVLSLCYYCYHYCLILLLPLL